MRLTFLKYFLFIAVVFSLIQFSACKKDQFITTSGAGLTFSMDTLTFDTVFTNLGNATRRFKVYNPHDQIIRINRAYLAGGALSDFNINIDGFTGTTSSDIEIPAKDSIYVFANVRIDPNNGDAVRVDSVLFETDGGGTQSVILHAYGWNAIYVGQLGDTNVTRYSNQNITLTNTQPYVFLGTIVIDSNSCITIEGGTEIYMYGGPATRPGDRAVLYIGYNSCIRSNVGGNLNNPVIFKTHRLEEDYQLIPFHHNGIYLSRYSRDNIIHGTIIRNAVDGIFVDSFSTNGSPKLELHNSKIYNVERSGVLGRGAHIQMTNTVIANSNQYNFIGIRGGLYNFAHCTFANVGAGLVSRSEPILSYRDYEIRIINKVETLFTSSGQANFTNCILYGTKNEEVEVLTSNNPQNFSFNFTNCLMKVDTFSQNMTACITNQDPLFVDEENFNYAIDSTSSPAKNAGASNIPNIPINLVPDIIGESRNINPSIGAYAIPD